MKRSVLAIYCLLFFLVISCKKQTITPLFETVVSGKFFEGNSNKPIEGAKISIVHEGKTIDSAFTDKNGLYSITLKTTNKDDTLYMWKFELDKKYFFNPLIKWIKLGELNVQDIEAREGIVLKARIICSNCPAPPLTVASSTLKSYIGNLSFLKLDNYDGDETVLLKVLPNAENTIHFRYDMGSTFYRYKDIVIKVEDSIDATTFNLDYETFVLSFSGN